MNLLIQGSYPFRKKTAGYSRKTEVFFCNMQYFHVQNTAFCSKVHYFCSMPFCRVQNTAFTAQILKTAVLILQYSAVFFHKGWTHSPINTKADGCYIRGFTTCSELTNHGKLLNLLSGIPPCSQILSTVARKK